MSVWRTYRERGFFQQATDAPELEQVSQNQPIAGYIGFDPTADSFHVGHLIPLMSLVHFQRAGHRPIALLGGGTAMIGDPTGKNAMRKMLSEANLEHNAQALRKQLALLLDFSSEAPGGGAIMANNAEWLRGLGYIDFLRNIGPHFSVNRMLTFETFKTRMETGLSFLEFNYPLLQSYDFLELYRRHGCLLQLGGDDQWANIISGVDLVRRIARKTVYGWTFPLHTTASGAKMGKTEQGAIWLDPDKTPPYQYFQYWVNLDDRDVSKALRLFSLLPLEEIGDLERLQGADIRKAKEVLAFEATRLVHGEAEAENARKGARAVFGTAGNGGKEALAEVPGSTISGESLAGGIWLPALLAELGLARSRGEGRRLIKQGGVSLNNQRISDEDFRLDQACFSGGEALLRVGKKKFHRLTLEKGLGMDGNVGAAPA